MIMNKKMLGGLLVVIGLILSSCQNPSRPTSSSSEQDSLVERLFNKTVETAVASTQLTDLINRLGSPNTTISHYASPLRKSIYYFYTWIRGGYFLSVSFCGQTIYTIAYGVNKQPISFISIRHPAGLVICD